MRRTDEDWERWGASSPYYGVLSIDKFRDENLSPAVLDEFFATGEAHVASLFSRIESLTGRTFRPRTALDFGCGVGRLAIPLAKRSGKVLALDISAAMLAETRRNCGLRGVDNVETYRSHDDFAGIGDDIDLVHSFIVLQHVNPKHGDGMLAALAKRVSQDGILAVQIYFRCNSHWLVRGLVKTRYAFPPAHWLRNIIKSRPLFEQAMQLHVYDLPRVLRMLRMLGFPEVNLHLDTEAGGQFESVFLLARRTHAIASIHNPLA